MRLMSERLKKMFNKFGDVFLGKKQQIQEFLRKFEDRILKDKQILNIERIDKSDKIATLGFRDKISSWRNPDGSPVISSCIVLDGEQKRYDYVLYLGETADEEPLPEPEKIDIDAIEVKEEAPITDKIPIVIEDKKPDKAAMLGDLESIFKDGFRLQHSFQFEKAIMQLDSMIDLLLERNLPDYVEKLEEKRNYLKAAQRFYEEREKELEKLDERISTIMADNKVIKTKTQFQEALGSINLMIEELKQKDFPNYLEKLEEKKQELIQAQNVFDQMKKELEEQEKDFDTTFIDEEDITELKNLERSIKINKEYDQFEAAKVNIEKMIRILERLERPHLIEKYRKELKVIEEKFDYIVE